MRYKTVKNAAQAEITEKKSRFIASVFPVETEQQAQEAIESVRKKHRDARHNCFAFRLSGKNPLQRFSDDGEPQGTAGKPILDVITGNGIENALVVVTRYFGGILLGTGGLVRAYSQSAKEGIKSAGTAEKVLCDKISITVDYNLSGKLRNEFEKLEKTIAGTFYTDKVKFVVLCEKEQSYEFVKKMTDITNAGAEIHSEGEIFAGLEGGKITAD